MPDYKHYKPGDDMPLVQALALGCWYWSPYAKSYWRLDHINSILTSENGSHGIFTNAEDSLLRIVKTKPYVPEAPKPKTEKKTYYRAWVTSMWNKKSIWPTNFYNSEAVLRKDVVDVSYTIVEIETREFEVPV